LIAEPMMKTTFKLIYYPHDKVTEILSLLERIKKSNLPIDVAQEILSDEKRADAIKQSLWPVAMLGKIQIRQTKSGLLYPHLLVYRANALVTFYPQRRKGESDITIKEFLTTVLTQNRRKNLVASFYATGRDCLASAEFLYRHRKRSSRYEILLTQSIESLLTAFILYRDADDPLTVIETLKHYRHDYQRLYDRCEKVDDKGIFRDKELIYIIHDLSILFFPSTIDARYPKVGLGNFRFMSSYFPILRRKLAKPLGKLLGLDP
jgi:hypothetical protein